MRHHVYTLIMVVAMTAQIGGADDEYNHITVKGQLMCDGVPLNNTVVMLNERDSC